MKKIDTSGLKSRVKNVYFWLGSLAVVLTAAGIGTEVATWQDCFINIAHLPYEPVRLLSTIVALLGVWVNPSTTGLRD